MEAPIAYSVSSCSDSMIEASKDFVIKLMVEEEGVPTIRRIRLFRIVDPQGRISYDKLVRLVASKVRYMHSHDVRLSYLDVDEDCVVVDSSDELMDAIDQFHDQQVLRLFVGEVTSAMRQAYLAHAGMSSAKRLLANASNGGDIEHIIERQIEIVLEKRFRLLEQQRREQENGGVRAVNSETASPSLLQRGMGGVGIRPDQSPLPHHHPSARRSPQSQPQQQSHPSQQHLRRHSFGSGVQDSEGWLTSPIRLDEYMDEEPGVLEEEEFLPNKNSRNVSRVRLSWEPPDESMDHRPPRPRKQGTPISGDKRNMFENPVGNYGFEHDDYDLSRSRGPNHRQKPPVRRNNRNPNLGSPEIPVLPATKRINISRDPAQTLDPRYLMDPSPVSPKKPKYRSPTPNDHQSVNDSLVSYRDDEDDFHPDEDDYVDDEGLRSEDELDLESDIGESVSPNQRIRQPATLSGRSANDDSHYPQDWETNTLDSDGELSLLLSDTDFRDHVDTRNDKATRQSISPRNTVEERRDPADDDQSRQSAETRRSAGSSRQEADDQNRDPSSSSKPPASPVRPLQPQQQSRQPQQKSRLQPPSPIKTPKTPTKASTPTNAATPTKASTPTNAATPNSAASTPTTSNSKTPVAARSGFNNIPRPTPTSQKKNKLLGILYNSE